MNNNLDILDSQDISLKKQLEKDAAAFREKKFRPEPEQYTELLDTRIQIRPDFRDKLIEQLKGTFGKYYDYHRRDIAANEVDYLNVEDPDVFSHRAWELEYQRKQEMRRNQPARTKCIFRKNCASVPEERSAIPLQTEQSSAGLLVTVVYSTIPARKFKTICLGCHSA